MERKNFINKFCIIDSAFIETINKNDLQSKLKNKRPYLVVELVFLGKNQLFGIPLQTNVRKSFDNRFWHKLPSRLETRQGMCHGLLYSNMIPLSDDLVETLKGADTLPPNDVDKRESIFVSIVSKDSDYLPENVKKSFLFMKKQVMLYGMNSFTSDSFLQAYKIVGKALHVQLCKYKDEHLDRIKNEAQDYLSQHYEKFLFNVASEKIMTFVDMPKHFTNIGLLVNLLDQQAVAAKHGFSAEAAERLLAQARANTLDHQPLKTQQQKSKKNDNSKSK